MSNRFTAAGDPAAIAAVARFRSSGWTGSARRISGSSSGVAATTGAFAVGAAVPALATTVGAAVGAGMCEFSGSAVGATEAAATGGGAGLLPTGKARGATNPPELLGLAVAEDVARARAWASRSRLGLI